MAALVTKPHSQQGLAMIVVLWVLTLIIIMASSFALTMRRETAMLGDFKALAQATAIAEAGVYIAVMQLLQTDERMRWRSDSSIYEITFHDVPIRISITDESGKIDLNQPDTQVLRSVLLSFDLTEEEADKLIGAITDWRDSDDLLSINGAEKNEYKSAGLTYSPRNQPFATIEELQMVLGMTPALYEQLEPLLTVFANGGAVNPAKAPEKLLSALPNSNPELARSYVQERTKNAREGLPETNPLWAATNGNASQSYTILAEAMPAEGVSAAISAVVRRGQSRSGLPFTILKWHKGSETGSLFTNVDESMLIQQ